MKKIIYSFLVLGLLASCGSNNSSKENNKKANGSVNYGGVFRMNEIEDFRSLYPLDITEVVSQRISSQVYEGLVKLSQADLTILPSLAQKWEKNADASQWIFLIRKGVKYHDDECFPGGKGINLR